MPKLDFGQKAPGVDRTNVNYLELKNKGEEIHIRFIGGPVYDGKHFFQDQEGKWNVSYCPRIMNEKPCQFCEKYFELKKAMKELGDAKKLTGEAKKTYDGMEQQARKYNVAISFYYPVLDREDQKVRVFKTGLSVRTWLDSEHEAGVAILDYDYKIKRLKSKVTDPGKDWYKFTRLDSSQIKPFTDEEQAEMDKFGETDLESIVINSRESSQEIEGSDA